MAAAAFPFLTSRDAFRPLLNMMLISCSAYKQTFDLHKLFYACSAWIPQKECTINVTGFKPDGSNVQRDLIFPALWEGIQPWEYSMNETEFGSEWEGLSKVDFNVTGTYAGVVLDDLQYSIKTSC